MLRARDAALVDRSAAHLFGEVFPQLLAARRAEARAIGGRYGFVVDERQWVLDLDAAKVRGDGRDSIVDDDDGLMSVVRLTEHELGLLLAGKTCAAELESRNAAGIRPLVAVLGP